MELENATKIDFGEVELLAIKNKLYIDHHNETHFKINWCRLKENPEILICLNESDDKLSNEIKEKDIEIIDIRAIVREKLIKIAEKELNEFIGKNIDNISYFFKGEENTDSLGEKYYTNPEFLKLSSIGENFLEGYESVEEKVKRLTTYEKYDEIENAKVKYTYGAYDKEFVEVNLKKNKILNESFEILSMLYDHNSLNKILAYKQYQLGITPKFYNEIAKINEFLSDKKNVKVVLTDGREVKVEASINNIINFEYGCFLLNGYKLDIPYENRNATTQNIHNLKSLKYGKNELLINTNNLIPLTEQLDELIKTKEKGIICNIEKDEAEIEQE